ncbi:LysR family transcriptional regulator [uncultured Vibrio sp.]|uniref:LysR family transcriptional regulator n=1 Tax=uncultured Vibrio sp. TaxID=114054 RepID=UPI0029C78C79|nr:LysR family transcriptional regulator [uncultured Vibrio sp.]
MKLAFDNLISFHAVVTYGSFSAGARKLGKSQSTVSGAVKSLEEMLGYALIDRDTKPIALTEPGKKLYLLASPIIKKYKDLNHVAESLMDGQLVRMCIGIDPLLFSPAVKSALIEFCDTFPGVELTVVTKPSHKLIECIDKDEIDFAIGNPYHRTTLNFNIDELFPVNCHWVVHQEQLNMPKVTESRLLLLDGYEYELDLSDMANNQIWVFEDINMIVDLCIAQKGIAFVPQHAITHIRQQEVLAKLPNESGLFSKHIYACLIWPSSVDYGKYHQWFHDKLRMRRLPL